MVIPDEVAKFLRDVEHLRTPQLSINPLSPEESARQSAQLANVSLFGEPLGLIILDDAHDSDPFCYISRGLGKGMVLHHEHDGEIRIQFPDLASFGAALGDAVVRGDHIDELRFTPRLRHPDQTALRTELRERLEADDEWTEPFARLFLPLLDPADVETLELAASSDDFFIRETVGEVMARDPLAAHLPLAARLAVDRHRQVQTPARRLLVALKAPLPPPTPHGPNMDDGRRPRTAIAISMLDQPDGKVRLMIDDLRRQGMDPPFTWNAQRFVVHVDINRELDYGGELDSRQRADLGGLILSMLERQRRETG